MKLDEKEAVEAKAMLGRGKTHEDIAEWFGCTVYEAKAATPGLVPALVSVPTAAGGGAPGARARTAIGLRDMLFDELESLQRGDSAPPRASAVANLAKQIVAVAKAEVDFRLQKRALGEDIGNEPLQLGSAVG